MTAHEFLAEQGRLAEAATEGPWEHGDRQSVAGVMPEMFGEGKCASCKHGEPSWVGERSINGRVMLAHVHESPEPWWKHGIYSLREDGSLLVVNDTDEYGYMATADAEFIAASRTSVPRMVKALEAVLREVEAYEEQPDELEPAGAFAQSIRLAITAALEGENNGNV